MPVVAQSICAHYSCFENMGGYVTPKKVGSKIWSEKSRMQCLILGGMGVQNCQKSSDITNGRSLTLFFAPHILNLFFKVQTLKKIRST